MKNFIDSWGEFKKQISLHNRMTSDYEFSEYARLVKKFGYNVLFPPSSRMKEASFESYMDWLSDGKPTIAKTISFIPL